MDDFGLFQAEDLNKNLMQLRSEMTEDDADTWVLRAITMILALSLAHQNGVPAPWPVMQHCINVLTATMPEPFFVAAGKSFDAVNNTVEEIMDLKEQFNMPSAEENDA